MAETGIKAIFFDVDGTLVGYQTHRINPTDIESLRLLREKGIKLFIATGRDLLIPNEAKIVEPILPLMTGIVNANGQRCLLTDGTEISYHPLCLEDYEPIRKCCEEHHFPILYYYGHNSYITEMSQDVLDFAEYVGIPYPSVRPLDEKQPVPQKICVYLSPADEAAYLKPLMKHSVSARNSDHLIDVIPAGIGKDNGIREICAYFGLEREETMAFGDGENDISMLKEAGTSIAMGIAAEKVRAEADYITGSSEEAGITSALRHYGLI